MTWWSTHKENKLFSGIIDLRDLIEKPVEFN